MSHALPDEDDVASRKIVRRSSFNKIQTLFSAKSDRGLLVRDDVVFIDTQAFAHMYIVSPPRRLAPAQTLLTVFLGPGKPTGRYPMSHPNSSSVHPNTFLFSASAARMFSLVDLLGSLT